MVDKQTVQKLIHKIKLVLQKYIPSYWDGKNSILEMKNSDCRNWKQNEWIGWYFQYLCEKHLPESGMTIPGNKFGKSSFDGNLSIDWDFKSHPLLNKDGKSNKILIANDLEATVLTIEQNGITGLIVAVGKAEFDTDGSFREWHTSLRGGESKYSIANKERGAHNRIYKTGFKLFRIDFFIISQDTLDTQGRFQEGMRNSNGNPRRSKLALNLETVEPFDSLIITTEE